MQPSTPTSATSRQRGPNEKPKRPLSAYNFFFRETREKLLANKQRTSFAGLAKMVSMKWKAATDTSRYEDLARDEKIRYIYEMEDWKKKERARQREERQNTSQQETDSLGSSHAQMLEEALLHPQSSQNFQESTSGSSFSPIPFHTDDSVQERMSVPAPDLMFGSTMDSISPLQEAGSPCRPQWTNGEELWQQHQHKEQHCHHQETLSASLHNLLKTSSTMPNPQLQQQQQQQQQPTSTATVPSISDMNLKYHSIDRLTHKLGEDAVDLVIEMFGND